MSDNPSAKEQLAHTNYKYAITQEPDFDVVLWNIAVDTVITGMMKDVGFMPPDDVDDPHPLVRTLDLPEDLAQLGPRPDEAIYRMLLEQKSQSAEDPA